MVRTRGTNRPAWPCLPVAAALVLAGCCQHGPRCKDPLPVPRPRALAEMVNTNARRVRTVRSKDISLWLRQGLGSISLDARLMLDTRTLHFRMDAGTGVGETEADVGANDELLWVYVPRQGHDVRTLSQKQLRDPASQLALPYHPGNWLDALGLRPLGAPREVNFFEVTPDTVVLYTVLQRPHGAYLHKKTFLDRCDNLHIMRQELYSCKGTCLAWAELADHTVLSTPDGEKVVVPTRVRFHWPQTNSEMEIRFHTLELNAPLRKQAFEMPDFGLPIRPLLPGGLPDCDE